ncbi:hypothetical protein CEXT_28051 [Caerostris extrusa]|uniref:Uncharacterized protein n=1 Tax=Caerostris extrusa TaxID=172846 RepID=A0AAV4NH44_CAEEX|nr:hypothetical protein CEXT_28051 [Caerostris extrusa]
MRVGRSRNYSFSSFRTRKRDACNPEQHSPRARTHVLPKIIPQGESRMAWPRTLKHFLGIVPPMRLHQEWDSLENSFLHNVPGRAPRVICVVVSDESADWAGSVLPVRYVKYPNYGN